VTRPPDLANLVAVDITVEDSAGTELGVVDVGRTDPGPAVGSDLGRESGCQSTRRRVSRPRPKIG
jgi:hypothetical protein